MAVGKWEKAKNVLKKIAGAIEKTAWFALKNAPLALAAYFLYYLYKNPTYLPFMHGIPDIQNPKFTAEYIISMLLQYGKIGKQIYEKLKKGIQLTQFEKHSVYKFLVHLGLPAATSTLAKGLLMFNHPILSSLALVIQNLGFGGAVIANDKLADNFETGVKLAKDVYNNAEKYRQKAKEETEQRYQKDFKARPYFFPNLPKWGKEGKQFLTELFRYDPVYEL